MSVSMKKIALVGAVMGSDVVAESKKPILERAKVVNKKHHEVAFLEVQEGKKEGQGQGKEGRTVMVFLQMQIDHVQRSHRQQGYVHYRS